MPKDSRSPPRLWLGGLCFLCTTLIASCEAEKQQAVEGVATPASTTAEAEWNAEVSEEFQVAAQSQLESLFNSLQKNGGGTDSGAAIVGSLRPEDAMATVAYDRGGVKVLRWKKLPREAPATTIVEAFASLAKSWPEGAEPRLKVKHFGVAPADDGSREVTTRTNFYAYAPGEKFSVQQQAEWRCRWLRAPDADSSPTLLSVELVELEEVRSDHAGLGELLADVTLPVLGFLPESLQYGANHWITRLPQLKHRFQHGIAVGDVDGDGLEDVYLCQPQGLPNILLVRQPDGTARDMAAQFGLDLLDNTTSAIFADFDNDGDQDLAAAFRSPFDIFENVDGKFERRFSLGSLGQIFSLSAADHDRDGLLDLYVCRYQNYDELGRARNAVPLHDAKNGGANALLKNLGDWKFEDATASAGLDHNNHGWSTAASWEDYDRDGDLDLYVANDYGRNNLYRCDTASDGKVKFRDIAAELGVEDMTTSMGATWGDPNRDGRPDMYVSNMYSSAGQRVTFQKNFKRNVAGADEAHVKAWQNAAMGNSLFQSGKAGTFNHTSKEAGIQKGLWSWGSVFADINHDGWEDLLVTNGFITGPSTEQDL